MREDESFFHQPKDATIQRRPKPRVHEFFAAVKNRGRYEVVAAPADADLVFEIGFTEQYERAMAHVQVDLH